MGHAGIWDHFSPFARKNGCFQPAQRCRAGSWFYGWPHVALATVDAHTREIQMLSVPILLGSSFTFYFLSFLFPFHVFPLDPAPWWEIRWHRHQQQHGWERQSMARVFSLFAAKILCNFFPFCVIFPELFLLLLIFMFWNLISATFFFLSFILQICVQTFQLPNFSWTKFF